MAEPVIAQRAPYPIELAPGVYWWCACGRSATPPFCDGSHKGSEFSPLKIELAAPEKLWLCGCKRSATRALCDGTHKRLP
jgi:CDGSH-type Zn-finger protein